MFHQFYCDSFLLIDRYSHFEILRWVKSSVLSQAAMIFQWIKPGGPPGLKYLGRTLNLYGRAGFCQTFLPSSPVWLCKDRRLESILAGYWNWLKFQCIYREHLLPFIRVVFLWLWKVILHVYGQSQIFQLTIQRLTIRTSAGSKCANTRTIQVTIKQWISTLSSFFSLQEKVAFPCIRLKTSDRQVSNR